MGIDSSGSKKGLYIILLIATVLIAIDIWYVVNQLQLRQVGYLLWEGGITILLLLTGSLLSFKFSNDSKTRNGILITYFLFIFDVVVMLNYATMATQIDKLTFYFHLYITASVILLVSMIGNIIGTEKKSESGFNIFIYGKDSPIPPKMLIPVWLIVFFVMGAFVFISGSVLLSYPQFGIVQFLGGPSTSGFGVANPENIDFLILPFAISMLVLLYFKIPKLSAFMISLIIGAVVFTTYHALIYSTNMIAIALVLIFGFVGIISYYYPKSLIILHAIHVGNNFWGALFAVTVIGISSFGVIPIPAIFILLFAVPALILSIVWLVKRHAK